MSLKHIKITILTLSAYLAMQNFAYAADVELEIRLKDKQIRPGRQTLCEILISDDVPVPRMPFINDLDIRYLQSRRDAGVNVHIYRIIGRRPGVFTIGPVVFNYNGKTYRSNAVTIEVTKDVAPSGREKAALSGPRADISKNCYLTLEAPRTTIFVNERFPIALNFYSDGSCFGSLSQCKIESDNLIVGDFYATENKAADIEGKKLQLTRRMATITAPTAGSFVVKPVTMQAYFLSALAEGGSADGKADTQANLEFIRKLSDAKDAALYDEVIESLNKRSVELKTRPLQITAVPLPEEGRPEDFAGAVGDFSMEADTGTPEAKVGQKVLLTVTIKGPGNYSTVTPPRIMAGIGIEVYEPYVEQRGEESIIFKQPILIRSPDVRQIPRMIFSYFNPDRERYVSISKGPFPLRVTGIEPAPEVKARPETKVDGREWIGDLKDLPKEEQQRPKPFYRSPAFALFEALPILLAIAAIVVYQVIRYLKEHPLYTASLVASRRARRQINAARSMLGRAGAKEFYNSVFRILQEYLGKRRLKPSEGVTSQIIDEIDMRGIEQDVADRIRRIFQQCYAARYTKEEPDIQEMEKTLRTLTDVVESLNRKAQI